MKTRLIEIADEGQDFNRFIVNSRNVITETKPFQGWVWNGNRIVQKQIRRGMKLRLRKGKGPEYVLRYPVTAVKSIAA